ELLVLQERVAARELGAAGHEGRAAGAGALRVVVHGHAAVRLLEGLTPRVLGAALGGRADAADLTAERGRAGGAGARAAGRRRRALVARAGREGERRREGRAD